MRSPARYIFAAMDPMKGIARAVLPQGTIARLEILYKRLQARRILAEPDRVYMREKIIPALLARPSPTILFIGVRSYTLPVLKQLETGGATVWTADRDPAAQRYGIAGRHAVADITDPPRPPLDRVFDAIVMNGVFGYGVNEARTCRLAFVQLRRLLASRGILVVGWNTDRCPALPLLAEGLAPAPLCGPPSVTFSGSTHRYDFFRRAAPAGSTE